MRIQEQLADDAPSRLWSFGSESARAGGSTARIAPIDAAAMSTTRRGANIEIARLDRMWCSSRSGRWRPRRRGRPVRSRSRPRSSIFLVLIRVSLPSAETVTADTLAPPRADAQVRLHCSVLHCPSNPSASTLAARRHPEGSCGSVRGPLRALEARRPALLRRRVGSRHSPWWRPQLASGRPRCSGKGGQLGCPRETEPSGRERAVRWTRINLPASRRPGPSVVICITI